MKNKKIIIILFCVILFIVLGGAIALHNFFKNKNNENAELNNGNSNINIGSVNNNVTRYEWIEMLCTQVGLTEYQSEKPYFPDVNMANAYFPYIQSAVEWGILNTDSDFKGDDYASGRFIALTAIKSIGESKLEIYLDTKEITDNHCIESAITNGLIREERLSDGFTREECIQVLEKLKNLYFGEFWKDDYSDVVYQDGIMELSPDDVLQNNADGSEVIIGSDIADSLDIGTIIVFEQKNTKIKIARKISGKDSDGKLLLEPVELDQVVESLTISDIIELTFEDIVNYYGLDESADAAGNLNYPGNDEKVINTSVFSREVSSKGYKFSISTEDEDGKKHLEIQITYHGTGVCYTLPIQPEVEMEDDYEIEIDVDKFLIGTQINYSVLKGKLNYIETAVDAHATLKGAIKAETDKKIPIFKTPVPLGGGVVGADIQVFLVLSAEGEISLEAELPVELSIYYEKGKGLRKFKRDSMFEDPVIKADCEISIMLRTEPTLSILGCLNVIDVEIDTGATGGIEAVSRPNSQICSDILIAFPVIKLSIGKDDDADTIIQEIGLSEEWDIISSEDAPIQKELHHEILPNGSAQFVSDCTYKESEEGEESDSVGMVDADTSNHTYYTHYREITQSDSPVFCFDYPEGWNITKEAIGGDSDFDFLAEYAEEIVELSNERGIKITFIKINGEIFNFGASGHYYAEYAATEIAKSSLAPLNPVGDESGNFVVVKLTPIGDMITDADEGYQPVEDAYVSYALLPQKSIDEYGGTLTAAGAAIGFYEMVSFEYPTPYVFYAESPDGHFTDEEEQEVVNILCSFKQSD